MNQVELRRGRDLAAAHIRARRHLKAWARIRAWLDAHGDSDASVRDTDRKIHRRAAQAQAKVEKHLFESGMPIWLRSRGGRRYIVRLDTLSEMLLVEQVGRVRVHRAF